MPSCITRVLFVEDREVGDVQQNEATNELTLLGHSSAIKELEPLVGKLITLRYG